MSEAQQKVDAVAARQRQSKDGLTVLVDKITPELGKALPAGGVNAQQFARILQTTLRTGYNLAQCTPKSITIAAFEAAGLGLPIDGVLGHAYLVPYRVKGVWTAQLQIGYRGFCELAYRSGKVSFIEAHGVRRGDRLDYQHGSNGFVRYQRPLEGEIGDLIGALAIAHLHDWDGPPMFRVLRLDEVHERRARSAAWRYEDKRDKSPWVTDEEAMFRKTAIRALAPTLPQTPQLQQAAIADELRDFGINSQASFIDVTGEDITEPS